MEGDVGEAFGPLAARVRADEHGVCIADGSDFDETGDEFRSWVVYVDDCDGSDPFHRHYITAYSEHAAWEAAVAAAGLLGLPIVDA